MKKHNIIFFVVFLVFAGCKNSKSPEHHLELIDNIKTGNTLLKVEQLAADIDVPWDMKYGADGFIWMTEQGGKVKRLNPETGETTEVLFIKGVYRKRTLGLLSLELHPDFSSTPYVFLNYTVMVDNKIYSRLERYTFRDGVLSEPKTILEIPGNTGHNGSRLAISSNKKLIWATGDAHHGEWAQDTTMLNGKILRINLDGTIPEDNPIKGSYVWAWGFRNMQGLAFSDRGYLYTSEHGDAIEDEVNLIEKGVNYGWPYIEGKHDKEEEKTFAKQNNTREPLRSWTPVIAPAAIAYYNSDNIPEWKNSILLTTLKSQTLRILKLSDDGRQIISEEILFENRYGRLRAICVSPKGDIFISTSNRDWNPQTGFPKEGDDRILKISKASKAEKEPLLPVKLDENKPKFPQDGKALYQAYCASCHKDDGTGVRGLFPPLAGAEQVLGKKSELIAITLNGLSGKITVKGKDYDQQMPAFDFLKDEELAKILTYVRTEFGNKAEPVNTQEIKLQRKN